MELDHLILHVKDAAESITFYREIMGFSHDGPEPPFEMIRVNDRLVILLAAFGVPDIAPQHYAFALDRESFETIFARLKDRGLPYGDAFDAVGNMADPRMERGGRGNAPSLYFNDPSGHLLEIRTYD